MSTSALGLTTKQTALMLGLQYMVTREDVQKETDRERKPLKSKWMHEWLNEMNIFIDEISKSDDKRYKVPVNWLDIDRMIKEVKSETKNDKTPLYLILLETVLFNPYYPLDSHSEEKVKKLKKLKLDSSTRKETLKIISRKLDIPEKKVDDFLDSYKGAINSLTGFFQKMLMGALVGMILVALTAGLATPYIASAFAASGLSGAAAMSAGLAALGGGAIAAGGAGVAGGIAVIVGGGMILGGTVGGTAGALFATSPEFTLSQAAKLEVVMKEIVLGRQKDTKLAQEILNQQRKTIQKQEEELDKMKMQARSDKDRIENLEKSIDYLKKALEKNMEYFKAA